jgi:hypothetical protein
MTAVTFAAHRPLSHRAALRLGRALTAWGARQPSNASDHAALVAALERHRERAARILPQLPR